LKLLAVIFIILSAPLEANGQQSTAPPQGPASAQPPGRSAIDDTIEAGESEAEEPKRKLVRWNEYDGPFFTIRFGAGVLYDYATYAQDDPSKQQFDLAPQSKFRDARVLLKGRLKFRRPVTWSTGIMYDGATGEWLFRETGIMVAVPELWGHVFVGRTKEGFSLDKVMVGYAGWTMERATISDRDHSDPRRFPPLPARSSGVSHGCPRHETIICFTSA
jgi:phosphate-selective porin OprO/OprP